ncbi:MAG: hypothetical protein ABII82_02360 [Verrucomicrobiota bacterium]
MLLALSLVPSAGADILRINFESPNYQTGESYNSSTLASTLATAGAPPDEITDLSGAALSAWTAEVQDQGMSGNRLLFKQLGSSPFAGQLEAFAPQGVNGQSGTWFAQMTYTRLTTQGGPLLSMRLVNDLGATMMGHPHNLVLYADNWQGQTLSVGVPHTLRIEIDMGTTAVRTYLNGLLLNTHTIGTNNVAGRSFGGLQLKFFGTTYPAGDLFALDNIRAGSVLTEDITPAGTVPENAYFLPVSQKAQLQQALDAYRIVSLEPGDYATAGVSAVTLGSNRKLYGSVAGQTIIPPVTVTPGTTGAVLARVKIGGARTITFPASSTPTSGNIFTEVDGRIVVNGGTLVDNLFLGLSAPIHVDTRTGGYLRNNRFIRSKVHGASPALTMLGDSAWQSYGNVFLWFNFLTPAGDATNIADQGDLTLAEIDAESWNFNGTGTNALFKVDTMGTLRCFGMNGGTLVQPAYVRSQYDIGATEFLLFSDVMANIPANPGNLPDLTFRSTNQRSAMIGTSQFKTIVDEAAAPFRVSAREGGDPDFYINEVGYASLLPPSYQTSLRDMISGSGRLGAAWETPSYGAIPDPAGPDWMVNRAGSVPDSTALIQGLIDTYGIARLGPGIFYISAPLKLANGQAIVGAGADSTVIMAKTSSLNMIVANDASDPNRLTSIRLADLTLQGGNNGIHWEPVGTGAYNGRYAQFNLCSIHHVTFRNFANAGMHFDKIYGVDNNFWSYLNFVDCAVGIKQTVDPYYVSGETPTMMFVDKVTFYKCQFIGNGLALDLPAKRGSNLNCWISCLFADNSEGVASMNNWVSTLFANCDFVNNGPVSGKNQTFVNNTSVSFLSCRFEAGASGGDELFGCPVAVEGCLFERAGSADAVLLSTASSPIFFFNSHSIDMPLNATGTTGGLLLNNTFGAASDAAFGKRAVTVSSGVPIALDSSGSVPQPQILFGGDWSSLPALFRGF